MATNKPVSKTPISKAIDSELGNNTAHVNPVLPLEWGNLQVDKIVVAAIKADNEEGYEYKRVSLGNMSVPAPYPFDSLSLAGQLVPVVVGKPTEDNPVPEDDISLYHYGDDRLDAFYWALVDSLKANALKGIVKGNGSKAKPRIYETTEAAMEGITFDTKGSLPDSWETLGATATKLTGAMQRKAYENALSAWLESDPKSKAIGGAVTALRLNLSTLANGMRTKDDLSAFLRWPLRKGKTDDQIGNLSRWMLADNGLQGLLDILANTADSGASALVHRTISGAIDLAMTPADEAIEDEESEF